MRKLSILILAAALVVTVSSMVLAGNFDVIVKVAEFIEVTAPDNIIIEIEDLENGATGSGIFTIASNTAFTVRVNSEGFENGTLNSIVSYSTPRLGKILDAGQDNEYTISDIPANRYTEEFKVSVEALDGVDDWTEITANDTGYTDTITYTVSAQ